MNRALVIVATMALSACGGSSTSTSTPDRTQPSQQEKAADVKTEAAGEHFQNGMPSPDKMIQAMKKQAPKVTQQVAKSEAEPAPTTP